MSDDKVLLEVRRLLTETLERDLPTLLAETRLEDIQNLDSIGLITLFLTVEGAFGVRFTTDEMSAMRTIGDIVAGVSSQLSR